MAEKKYQETIEKYGPEQEVGFPNTAYYLPIIYAMTGIKVAKIEDMKQILDICRRSDTATGSRECAAAVSCACP